MRHRYQAEPPIRGRKAAEPRSRVLVLIAHPYGKVERGNIVVETGETKRGRTDYTFAGLYRDRRQI